MIGKRVDGQFPLKIDGKLSEIPAITIEGVSYIPLRAAGELFGAQVSWLDGEIIMEKINKNVGVLPPTAEEMAEIARIEQERLLQETEKKNEILMQKSRLRGEIQTLQFKINALKREIESREEGMKKMPEYVISNGELVHYEGSELQKKHQEDLAKLKQELADLEAQLAELEQQKAELEAELQKHEAAQ
jgi:chromosome segregation ATPase